MVFVIIGMHSEGKLHKKAPGNPGPHNLIQLLSLLSLPPFYDQYLPD